MIGMTDEEFEKICRTKFDFGADLEACLKYYHDGKFDKYDKETGEKVNIPEDTKYLFTTLKEASQTNIGAQVLNQLDDNTKITLFIDRDYNSHSAKKSSANGYHTSDHQIALTGTKRSPRLNATSLIHELTHEIQLQQGGVVQELKSSQDRVMANKMEEAEARLNAAYALKEIYPNLGFMEKCMLKPTDDYLFMLKLKEAEEQNLSSDATKKELLQAIYKDKRWSEIYDEQVEPLINYKISAEHYALSGDVSLDNVRQSFMKRLNLSQEDMDWFFNPDNIASSPKDLKRKSMTTYSIEQGDFTCRDVMEDGKVVQRFLLGKDGKKMTEEYISDEGKFVKVFDQDEKICSSYYTRTATDGSRWKYIRQPEYNSFLGVKMNNNDEILSISLIYNGKNQISPQQSKELAEQYRSVYDTFSKIKDGKGTDEDIALAYKFIREDKFGLYSDNPVLLKTINNEAIKKGIDKKYCSDRMQEDSELAQQIYNNVGLQYGTSDDLQAQASITPILYNYKSSKEQTI